MLQQCFVQTSFTCVLQEAAILGALCFVMALVVLLFFSSVLLNIVDAVFMCYALDLDTQSVTKSEVHEVFSQVREAPSRHIMTHSCMQPPACLLELFPEATAFVIQFQETVLLCFSSGEITHTFMHALL